MKNSPTFRDFWSQKYAATGCFLLTREFSQRIGAIVAWAAFRLRLSANTITIISYPLTLIACAVYLLGDSVTCILLAALIFQLAFGLDCADGQLARATGKASIYGAWLDIAIDHTKEIAISLTLMFHLANYGLNWWICAISSYLYLTGTSINLHTVNMLKQGHYPAHGLQGQQRKLKNILMTLKDTPTFLLIICMLSFHPLMLACFISVIGLLNLAGALTLARLRILKSPASS